MTPYFKGLGERRITVETIAFHLDKVQNGSLRLGLKISMSWVEIKGPVFTVLLLLPGLLKLGII